MNNERIIDYLKNNLSDYRFRHTIGVAETAKELASIYGENQEEAYLAGLLHDIAKELSLNELLMKAKEYGAAPDCITKTSTALMHGFVGAYMAKDLFKVSDAVFGAITYHTTGKADMTLLEKIIYIADFTEPQRTFQEAKKLREIVRFDINGAILSALDFSIIHTVNKGGVLHPDTVKARNYLLLYNGSGENEKIRN